jgi:hypothetical protein
MADPDHLPGHHCQGFHQAECGERLILVKPCCDRCNSCAHWRWKLPPAVVSSGVSSCPGNYRWAAV